MSEPSLASALASVDEARDEIVTLLQDLVRIPTVNAGPRADTGGESRACDLLRPKLEAAGIAVEVHESAPGRGNLLARIGRPNGQRLLLMSHTDVVPVEDESLWEHPPFSGTLDRGRVYGRGSDDDKGDVVAQCMALVLLQRAGVQLAGEAVYLAAADEESGGRWGAGWLAETLPDRIRADFAVNEGGGSPIHAPGGLLYPLATGEKGRLEARVTRQGRSGHASRPWAADNPVPILAEVIQRIQAYEPEIDVSHPFFREVLSAMGIRQAPTAENIDRIADSLQDTEHRALGTTLKAASRMTMTPTMLAAGVKSNSIPDRASLVCDVRGLPGQDDAFVRAELDHLLEGLDVNVEVAYTAVSNASPSDTPFVGRINAALAAALGEHPFRMIPSLTVGFTDSRFLRPLGTPVYGFSPHHPSAEPMRTGVHGNNEFMEVESLLLRTKFALALTMLTVGG
ncbi:MAG TPA: M20/M25/M40 family metallo-hydrolase [Chloroflexota bacterium]|nr:M20/M25/M40 family metallo-hydrolase [Chloroflexota bacterium]